MKNFNQPFFLVLIMLSVFFSCKNEKKKKPIEESKVEAVIEEPSNVISVITRSMEFQSVDTIPSGWNTFKYRKPIKRNPFLFIR